jgi:hypothetical protein
MINMIRALDPTLAVSRSFSPVLSLPKQGRQQLQHRPGSPPREQGNPPCHFASPLTMIQGDPVENPQNSRAFSKMINMIRALDPRLRFRRLAPTGTQFVSVFRANECCHS